MKKIILAIIILIFGVTALVWYLDKVIFPTKIKEFLITEIKIETGKDVLLESLHFSLFKGVVFKNLSIHEGSNVILHIKEGSCRFLYLPFLRNKLIIPSLEIKSAEFLLEKNKQGAWDLNKFSIPEKKSGFKFIIYKVRIIDSRLIFRDRSIEPEFSTKLDKINLSLYFSLPSRIKFSLYCLLGKGPGSSIEAQGQYYLSSNELNSQVFLHNFSAQEFMPYYRDSGITNLEGISEVKAVIKLKDDILTADIGSNNKSILLNKDKIKFRFNSIAAAELKYYLKNNKLTFSGKAELTDSRLSGLEFAQDIDAISGRISFNESGLSSDNLSLNLWGLALKPKIKLDNFQDPELSVDLLTEENAVVLESVLRDKFKADLPFSLGGRCKLYLLLKGKPLDNLPVQFNGYLDMQGATLKFQKLPSALEFTRGKIEFERDKLNCQALNFRYGQKTYRISASLKNYKHPAVRIKLSGQDLQSDCAFKLQENILSITEMSGKYLNSKFSFLGQNNTLDLSTLQANINSNLDFDCQDLKSLLPALAAQLDKINLQGLLHSKVALQGKIDDLVSCRVVAEASAPLISFYGLNAKDMLLRAGLDQGIINLSDLSFSLYEGSLKGAAKFDLKSTQTPFWMNASAEGVNLEKAKVDLGSKAKDISGVVNGQVKLDGLMGNMDKVSGTGKVFITHGKLWQLNLFQGLGSLLFSKDFANIVFTEGYCAFTVGEGALLTDNITLKSNIANMYGPLKIGFGGAIDGNLNVEILDDNAPVTGTFKDLTTAIIGRAGKFGVIKISGTLSEPKYKFKPAVSGIVKGIKDTLIP